MSESKKRNDKESIICLTPGPRQKKMSEIIGVSLWTPSRTDHNPLDYSIWDILENNTNGTSHSNNCSFKTAIEEEWNKMSEEFILKARKSFRTSVDTIIVKMAAILTKFTFFLSIFLFCCLFFEIKINLDL